MILRRDVIDFRSMEWAGRGGRAGGGLSSIIPTLRGQQYQQLKVTSEDVSSKAKDDAKGWGLVRWARPPELHNLLVCTGRGGIHIFKAVVV